MRSSDEQSTVDVLDYASVYIVYTIRLLVFVVSYERMSPSLVHKINHSCTIVMFLSCVSLG